MKNNNDGGAIRASGKTQKEPGETKEIYIVEVPLQKGTVAQLIKGLRKIRKYSQERLGQLIGVQKSQVSKLERGSNNITLGTMIKIFTALKAKVSIKVELGKKKDLKAIEDIANTKEKD